MNNRIGLKRTYLLTKARILSDERLKKELIAIGMVRVRDLMIRCLFGVGVDGQCSLLFE